MRVIHPNGRSLLFMQDGTQFMADMELPEGWVTFGYLGGSQSLLVDVDEWPAFVEMVLEIDVEKNKGVSKIDRMQARSVIGKWLNEQPNREIDRTVLAELCSDYDRLREAVQVLRNK